MTGLYTKCNTGLKLVKQCGHLNSKMLHIEAGVHRCSEKFRNIHRKTPVLESPFNKVACLQACNVTKKRLQRR